MPVRTLPAFDTFFLKRLLAVAESHLGQVDLELNNVIQTAGRLSA
jgi:hypothetical protein